MAHFYEENPPNTWEECELCGGYHPPTPFPTRVQELAAFDCRNDINRWPSDKAIAYLIANPQP